MADFYRALIAAEESTAEPTPASSDCSSGFSQGLGAVSASAVSASQVIRAEAAMTAQHEHEVQLAKLSPVQLAKLAREHETAWARIKDAAESQIHVGPEEKAPVNAARIAAGLAIVDDAEKRSSAAQAATRSRSAGKNGPTRMASQGKSLSPVRNLSPRTDRSTGTRVTTVTRQRSAGQRLAASEPRERIQIAVLETQKTALETALEESQKGRAALETELEEAKRRAMEERSKLHRLAARIDHLEGSREVNSALLEDNRFLRAELEAEKLQVAELTQQLELLKGHSNPPTVVLSTSQEKLLRENEKLREDLKQSQVMLAKYTEELSMIMPDVELILTQWKTDGTRNGATSPGQQDVSPTKPSSSSQQLTFQEEPVFLPAKEMPVEERRAAEVLGASRSSREADVLGSSRSSRMSPTRLSRPQQRTISPGPYTRSGFGSSSSARPRSSGKSSTHIPTSVPLLRSVSASMRSSSGARSKEQQRCGAAGR